METISQISHKKIFALPILIQQSLIILAQNKIFTI